MKKKSKVERFYWKAVHHMWETIGVKFNPEEAALPEWYEKRVWSPLQEAKYREWFVRHARKDLRISKKQAEEEAAFFLLNWGWKREKAP